MPPLRKPFLPYGDGDLGLGEFQQVGVELFLSIAQAVSAAGIDLQCRVWDVPACPACFLWYEQYTFALLLSCARMCTLIAHQCAFYMRLVLSGTQP